MDLHYGTKKDRSEARTMIQKIAMLRPRILGRLAWLFVMIVNWSVRVRFLNKEFAEYLMREKKSVIFAFYHGDMIPLLHAYRNSGVLIPASESRDGEIMSRVLKNFGFSVARGSSKRKGHRALRELITGMREGKIVAITVDGPRGPLHTVKPGAVYLAGFMQAPIVPVAVSAERFRLVKKSWDRLMIPAPFTECRVLFGNPVYVTGTSEEEINAGRIQLEACLHGLKQRAEAEFPGCHGGLHQIGNTGSPG